MQFFRERRPLQFLRSVRRDSPNVDYPNVDGFIGAIISEKQATLRELKTIISLEEAFDIWEVIMVNRYNEYMAAKERKKK